jgi:subtilisin family serine protease
VKYVEQDQEITLGVGKPVKSGGGKGGKGGKTTATPPVDSGVTVQTSVPSWGLDRVDQTLIPMDGNYAYDATGAGVNVYIIDSGIRITHSEFGGRATADYSIIDDGYGAIGCNWHGTHVAGIVGGETAGVAKDVLLHSVRILDCNAAGSVSGAVEGIDWVIANQVAPAVINLSVAASSSQVLTDAVDRAIAAGITVVVAAGNNAADACNFSPANATAAITVGATNSGDQQADFSNFGSCVDLMAPGDAIMSASSSDDTSLQYGSGTSMAAPYVAGTAALYLEKDPAADPATVTSTILQGSTGGLIGGLGLGTPNLLIRTR